MIDPAAGQSWNCTVMPDHGRSTLLTAGGGESWIVMTLCVADMRSDLAHRSSVSEPARTDLELRIDQVLSTGQLSVSLHNKAEAPLRMWRGGMMDIARWRALHIGAISGHLNAYYQDPDQIFDARNNYRDLISGKPWLHKLDLTSSFWLPHNAGERGDNIWATGDTVIVCYDIPISDEGSKRGVWRGVAAARAVVG